MDELNKLELFLATAPLDSGCGKAMELMDVYVDLLLAGREPQERYPDVAAHLRDCAPCREDLEGLREAAAGDLSRPR